jgi:hypothetical protein
MLVLAWAIVPMPASASGQAAVAESSLCTVDLTVHFNSPVGAAQSTATGTPVGYQMSGYGSCDGASLNVSLGVNGVGQAAVPPSCVQWIGTAPGSVVVGPDTYPVTFAVAGATAAPELVILAGSLPQFLPLGVSGIGQLAITTASLQACLQPGGTTTLQYTGVVLLIG